MSAQDLGSALSLSGTGITTSYQAGTSFAMGRAAKVRFEATVVLQAASNCTSFQLKVQASSDGTNWYDVATQDDSDEIIAPLKEHTYAASAAGTYPASIFADGTIRWLRCEGKFTGGAGKAGETFSVTALALK